jgi:hypothetical protein
MSFGWSRAERGSRSGERNDHTLVLQNDNGFGALVSGNVYGFYCYAAFHSPKPVIGLKEWGKSTSGSRVSREAVAIHGERVKYFEMLLENVLIGSIKPGLTPTGGMQEHFQLKFSKVTWKYTAQKISGGAGGSTAGGWCLSTNKVVA